MNGYIYKIVNDINDKVYIGKTLASIEKRFYEHCKDSKDLHKENRPLYKAMNKYGIEHFSIQEIEQVSINDLSQREQYWINQYDSYHNGYNATLGGEGKQVYDYEVIIQSFLSGKIVKELAQEFECDQGTIGKVIALAGLDSRSNEHKRKSIPISAYDLDGQLIQSFESSKQASEWLYQIGKTKSQNWDNITATIGRVANGKRKSAYGLIWKRN